MAQQASNGRDGGVGAAAADAPGWYPDPFFLGRERYWDGLAWTEQCRVTLTGEQQPSVAPRPPKDPGSATPAALAARRAARAVGTAAPVVAAAATAVATETLPMPDIGQRGTAAGTTSWPTEPVRQEHQPIHSGEGAAGGVPPREDDTWEYEDGWTPPNAATIARTRRRFLTSVVVIVVLGAAVGIGVLVTGKKKGNAPSANAVGPIAQAAAATISQQYAQVSVGLQVDPGQATAAAAGVSGFSASGADDLGPSVAAFTLSGPGNAGNQSMVLDAQTIYLEPGQLVAQLVPGKAWVSATAADLGAVSTPTGFVVAPTLFEELIGSPTALLQQLEVAGSTATDQGALIYQGTPVEEYAFTLSPQAAAQRLNALPPSLSAAIESTRTEHVYLTTNGLVRAITVPVALTHNGTTVRGQVALGLTAWGATATIGPPPADQVAPWAQLKAALTYASAHS